VLKKGRLGGHLVLARKVQVHKKDRGLRSKNVHSAQHKKVPPSAHHKKPTSDVDRGCDNKQYSKK